MSVSGSGRWQDEDDPSLVLSRGLELTDRERGSTLSTAWTARTDDIVNDRELQQRYRAAGIEHVFLEHGLEDGRSLTRAGPGGQ